MEPFDENGNKPEETGASGRDAITKECGRVYPDQKDPEISA